MLVKHFIQDFFLSEGGKGVVGEGARGYLPVICCSQLCVIYVHKRKQSPFVICFVIFLCPLYYITYLCALHSTINIYICCTDYSVSGPLGVQGKAAFKKVQKVSENTTHAHCIWCTCTQIFCYLKICADNVLFLKIMCEMHYAVYYCPFAIF